MRGIGAGTKFLVAGALDAHSRGSVCPNGTAISRRSLIGFFRAALDQDANRVYNMNYQKARLAFAHLKACAEVRVYLRTPTGRYLERERKQQRALREKQRVVCFAGALSTDIRVLASMPHNDQVANPFADAYRGDGTYDSEQFYATEHDYRPDPCVI